jgi:GT2 family glycosyltransferase
MADVAVTIPTFRRPDGLERLLKALGRLDTQRDIKVIVADNDAGAHEGADLCHRMTGEKYRWTLDAIVVPERGIAQVRNALVTRAFSDPATQFIAMLDDDEWPEPEWLEGLLRAQAETGADIVRGSVLREFEVAPPLWATTWEGIAPIHYAADYDGPIEGTGNVLIARRCFESLSPPYFDPQFGLTGGEDRDFFIRLGHLGMRFARTRDAIAYEHVPADRIRLGWSLRRAYRTGNSDMRIALKYKRGAGDVMREAAKILAALAAFPILCVAFAMNPTRRLDGVQKLFRAAGKIGALLGHRYYEYSPHG